MKRKNNTFEEIILCKDFRVSHTPAEEARDQNYDRNEDHNNSYHSHHLHRDCRTSFTVIVMLSGSHVISMRTQ